MIVLNPKEKVFLVDVFESIDAYRNLFSEHLEDARKEGNPIDIARHEGQLEALKYIKRDLGYGKINCE